MSTIFRQTFQNAPSGTVSGSSVAQLVAIGIVDSHLTAKPDHSFWRAKIKQHSNFAMETITESFSGNVNWGSETNVTISKTPDLVSNFFVVLDRPGIIAKPLPAGSKPCGSGWGSRAPSATQHFKTANPTYRSTFPSRPPTYQTADYEDEALYWDEEDPSTIGSASNDQIPDRYCHWVNNLGWAAIARCSISLAGVLGQILTGRFMHAWASLTGQPGKGYGSMVGSYNSLEELIAASSEDQRLYIQIPFSCTAYTSRALPLVSMRFHSCIISLGLTPLHKLIKVSHPDVEVIKVSDGQPITKSDVECSLDVQAVFLDLEERKRFASGSFSQLFIQTQYHEATYTGASIRAPLNFSHPSRGLIFCVQRKSVDENNETFDYSSPIRSHDPVQFARLVINTTSRFAREGMYFRKVMPYLHATRTLKEDNFLYMMPFGLNLDGVDTNGTLNLSRIDNCTLHVDLHPEMSSEPVTLYVYDVSVNIISFRNGLVTIEYQ